MEIVLKANESDVLIIFDFSSIAHQAYHSNPANPHDRFLSICAEAINRSVLSGEKYCLLFALDNFPIRRFEIYRDYKKNRISKEDSEDPKKILLDALKYTKSQSVEAINEEADDVIATICKIAKSKKKVIVTADSDMHALMNSKTRVFDNRKNHFVDGDSVTAIVGLLKKFVKGDTSDSIPPIRKRMSSALTESVALDFVNSRDKIQDLKSEFLEFAKNSTALALSEAELECLKMNIELVSPNSRASLEFRQNSGCVREDEASRINEALFQHKCFGMSVVKGGL